MWSLTFSLTNWFFFWASLEVLNWIFLWWIKEKLKFLMWQSIISLTFLFFWLLHWNYLAIGLILISKMGLPPLSNWIWSLFQKWEMKIWTFFLSLHKILPLILFLNMNLIEFWIFLWIFFSLIMAFWVFSFKSMIFISSISDASWLLLASKLSMSIFWMYILFYSFIWWFSSINWNYFLVFVIILLLGLPPSLFFLFKLLIWISTPLLMATVISFLSLLIFLVYWNYFSLKSFQKNLPSLSKLSWKWVLLFMGMQLSWSLIL